MLKLISAGRTCRCSIDTGLYAVLAWGPVQHVIILQ